MKFYIHSYKQVMLMHIICIHFILSILLKVHVGTESNSLNIIIIIIPYLDYNMYIQAYKDAYCIW